jgi:hypothetical protein
MCVLFFALSARHAFFIEDGVEVFNRIENNLACVSNPSMSLLNTDQTPASFWITNPHNYVSGNAAAGSANYGFWYRPEVRSCRLFVHADCT